MSYGDVTHRIDAVSADGQLFTISKRDGYDAIRLEIDAAEVVPTTKEEGAYFGGFNAWTPEENAEAERPGIGIERRSELNGKYNSRRAEIFEALRRGKLKNGDPTPWKDAIGWINPIGFVSMEAARRYASRQAGALKWRIVG